MQDQSILEEEKKILKEEQKILQEEKNILHRMSRNVLIMVILVSLILVGGIGGFIYWKISQSRVYVEKAQISAPHIELSAQNSGVLAETFVNEGDIVTENTALARVGNELIKAKTNGLIIDVKADIGKLFNRGEPVVIMISLAELRVVGQVEEDKGLKDISVGQQAIFTVDAFGSKKYIGTVDEISPVSKDSGVIFNISDKREVKQFNVKIRFNIDEYTELKDGMSAKIWIYKN